MKLARRRMVPMVCRDRNLPARKIQAGRRRNPLVEALEMRTLLTTLPVGFSEGLVAGGLGKPTAMDVLPDGRAFITTQGGDLRVVKNGSLLQTPFLHLTVDSSGERGLLGVAHDPNFANDHFIYVYHTVPASAGAAPFNEVSRFTASGDVARAGSEVDILRLNDLSRATNHNGGSIHFGTDNLLYIGVGENANPANSQTLNNLLGKVLRIDVSRIQPGDPLNDVAKLVPTGNPFFGQATGINQAIYALGFRNPFTFAVQPVTGKTFINDVGLNTWEEIDKLAGGGNYGWDKSEGFAPTVPPNGLGPGTYQDPQLAYNHSGGPAGGGDAIVGGSFYDPPAGVAHPFPSSYIGKYLYEDLGRDWIRVFDPAHPGSLANPDTSSGFATGTVSTPVDMAVAPDGGLYYLARGSGGELLKISYRSSNAPLAAIDAGGGAVGAFMADSDFTGGNTNQVSNAIDTSHVANPAPQRVYQSWRFGNFTYTIPGLIPGSSYKVRLDFSENVATAPGQRVFNVAINGSTVLSKFDIFAVAGGRFRALEKDFTAKADSRGRITLTFKGVVGPARVNGITISSAL